MAKTNKGRKLFATTATAALVASAIVPVASAAQVNDYNSISSYAQEAVQDLVDRGVITGDEKGNFNPKKSVTRAEAATILTGALGLTTDSEVNFTDVKASAWYYDAINAAVNNGVFSGKGAGIFEPTGNLTRGEAAVILVNAFGLEGSTSLAQFSDEKTVKAWAKEALEIAVANDVIKGDNGKVNANAAITKQDFAVMFSRAEAAAEAVAASTVKAINATTVEVTFPEAVTNLSAVNFAIEGLTISNKVVKQTDAKTVVLTTAAQEGGKEYTVTVDDKAVGKFTGIAAVIPTAINVDTASLQGTIGKDVTVKASVTVPEGQSKAGIPVTFNIVNDNSNLNNKIEVVEYTDENGVASHTYTRYYEHNDNVVAYATQKSSVSSQGKVYWNAKLAITEITTGNELANNTKKSYKVSGKANTIYQITLKENVDVTPDKVNKTVKVISLNGAEVTPAQVKGATPVFAEVRTDANGEGTFTVFGTNGEATPVVYLSTETNKSYTKYDLQAEAPVVKFSQVDRLALTVAAEGKADSAQYASNPNGVAYNANSVGGRTYTVTVTDKEGKLAPVGTVAYVAFEDGNISGDVYFSTGITPFTKVGAKEGVTSPAKQIVVGKDGKAQFRVAGTGSLTFVKPTVFLNTAGAASPAVLDKTDVQQVAEVTYFKAPVVTNALLSVTDQYGRTVSSLTARQDAYFTYQSVDQNGFAYRPAAITTSSGTTTTTTVWVPTTLADGTIGYKQEVITIPGTVLAHEYNLSFDVTSTFGNAIVKDALGVILPVTQNLGNTKTYTVKSDANGKAIVRVTSETGDQVSVNVTGSNNILPTAAASVQFVNSTVVPAVYSGDVASYDSQTGKLTFVNKTPVDIFGSNIVYTKGNEVIANYDAFIALLANATGTVSVTRTVGTDGVTTFNIYNIATTGAKPVDTASTVFTPQTQVVTNDATTLGLTATTATSSAPTVATASVTASSVAISSVAPGTAVITVADADPATTDATINVTVSTTGAITYTINKAGAVNVGTQTVGQYVTTALNTNAFGEFAIAIPQANLTGDLAGATAVKLTVNGTDYAGTLTSGYFVFAVPTSATEAAVKAGILTKTN